MSLYNSSFRSSERGSQQGSRSSRAPYSLASGKVEPVRKTFELSMDDDFDDRADMSDMDYEKTSRPTEYQPRVGGKDYAAEDRNGGPLYSRRGIRTHSYDEQAFAVTPSTEGVLGKLGSNGRDYERQNLVYDSGGHSALLASDDRSQLSPEYRSASTLELSQENEQATSHPSPATYRASQQSSDSTARVRFDSENQSQPANDSTTTRALGSNDYAMAETPALKPPVHPAQGSTVTSRWKRRGRLGLAKPKRNDPSLPSEESTQDGDRESMDFGSNSPPKSHEFLGGSSISIDHKPLSTQRAQSPARSYLSGYGSIDSENSQRQSYVAMDEPVPEFESTFHTARSRYSKSPPDAHSGSAIAGRMPYESSAQNMAMDMSDVSMNSNPRSRPHSPDIDSATKAPTSAGSLSRTSLNDNSGSNSKQASEPRQAEGGDVKGYGSSNLARRLALSPLLGRTRPLGSSVGSASSESLGQRAELGTSPKKQIKRDSPHLQGPGLVRASTASSLEKRSSAYGDSAMQVSTRFQQYEMRRKETSPQYRSPRERQRAMGGLVRSADTSMGSADSSRIEEAEQNRLDSYAPPEPKSSSRRLNSASSSVRV
ncbi:hypothetical protein IWW57_005111, partial [Coemansia sp. S610]